MVLSYVLRCLRYRHRGIKVREAALSELRAGLRDKYASTTAADAKAAMEDEVRQAFARRFIGHRATTTAYCGLHTIDMAGHVNNAKYLELLEYGRWYHLSLNGTTDFVRKKKGIFVVSELSIQYVREIRPFTTVQVTTQQLPMIDRPLSTAAAADTTRDNIPSPATKGTGMGWNDGNNKRVLISQAIWNEDGSKLHAAALMEAAYLGPVAYAEHLEATYGKPKDAAAASANGSSAGNAKVQRAGRVTLDCHRVIADCANIPITVAEDILYEARENFLLSMAKAQQPQQQQGAMPQWLSQMTSANSEWRRNIRNMSNPSTPQKRD